MEPDAAQSLECCEKSGQVVFVDLSKRRASINYERNKERENLTIMVGNLNDMSFDQPFDYVVVNGVLEYAMSFTKGDTPYETFLENMGQYLNEAGKILIAIENKLGLKYFAGCRSYSISIFLESTDIRGIIRCALFPKRNWKNC